MNNLEILKAFESFLKKQKHLKEDFIAASLGSAREHLNKGGLDGLTPSSGIVFIMALQDKMWLDTVFEL